MAIEGVAAMVEAEGADSEEEDREDIKIPPSFIPKISMCINYSGIPAQHSIPSYREG
jgi:hypothetical protein